MLLRHAVIFAMLGLSASGAFAINKCTGADGKVAFQDAPCAGKGEVITVKPASGAAPRPVPVASGADAGGVQQAAPKKVQDDGVFGEKYRRRLDLESHLIRNARADLDAHMRSCSSQQASLASKKNLARNNLAGATWEQSISAEMQAAAASCDTRVRDLRSQIDSYERELRELKAEVR